MKLLSLAAVVSAQISWSPGNNVNCEILTNSSVGAPPNLAIGTQESTCCAAYATGVAHNMLNTAPPMATNLTLPQCYSLGFGQACDFSTVPTVAGVTTAGGITCMDNQACARVATAGLLNTTGALNSALNALAPDYNVLCNVTNTGGAVASCKPYYGASVAAGRIDFGDQTFDCCSAATGLATYGVYGSFGNVTSKALIGSQCYAVGAGQSCDPESGSPTVGTFAATLGVLCQANGTASACGDSALAGLKAANATLYGANIGMIAQWDPLTSNSLSGACAAWQAALANLTATTQAAASTAAASTAAASTAAAGSTAAAPGSTAAPGTSNPNATTTAGAGNANATTASASETTVGDATTTTEAAGTTSGSYVAKALATLFFC